MPLLCRRRPARRTNAGGTTARGTNTDLLLPELVLLQVVWRRVGRRSGGSGSGGTHHVRRSGGSGSGGLCDVWTSRLDPLRIEQHRRAAPSPAAPSPAAPTSWRRCRRLRPTPHAPLSARRRHRWSRRSPRFAERDLLPILLHMHAPTRIPSSIRSTCQSVIPLLPSLRQDPVPRRGLSCMPAYRLPRRPIRAAAPSSGHQVLVAPKHLDLHLGGNRPCFLWRRGGSQHRRRSPAVGTCGSGAVVSSTAPPPPTVIREILRIGSSSGRGGRLRPDIRVHAGIQVDCHHSGGNNLQENWSSNGRRGNAEEKTVVEN